MKIKLRRGCRDEGRTSVGNLQVASIPHCHTLLALIGLLEGEFLEFGGDMIVGPTVEIPRLLIFRGVLSIGSHGC